MSRLKKFGVATAALAAIAGSVSPAAAHGRGYYDGGYAYYGHAYRGPVYGPAYGAPVYYRDRKGISSGAAAALGVGALGLGLVLGNAFDKDRPSRVYDRGYDRPYRPYDRGYDGGYGGAGERARLENEQLRLENERLRLENEEARRALYGRSGYEGRDLDDSLLGGDGRIRYDAAFRACLSAAERSAGRDLTFSAPATWREAQPLGADEVRFRARVDSGGRGVEMICDAGPDGVRRVDFDRN